MKHEIKIDDLSTIEHQLKAARYSRDKLNDEIEILNHRRQALRELEQGGLLESYELLSKARGIKQ